MKFKEDMESMVVIKIEKYLNLYKCPCGHEYHQFRQDKAIMPCPKCHRRKWNVKDDHPDIALENMNDLKERTFRNE